MTKVKDQEKVVERKQVRKSDTLNVTYTILSLIHAKDYGIRTILPLTSPLFSFSIHSGNSFNGKVVTLG